VAVEKNSKTAAVNNFPKNNFALPKNSLPLQHQIRKKMQTAGIAIERNSRGEPAFVRIDLKKHGDKLKDFFASNHVTLEEPPYDPEFVAKIRRAEQQVAEGKCTACKTKEELTAFLNAL
jgi:hypothetical protein